MKLYLLEILRQKWCFLSVIAALLLLNVILAALVSYYQLPSLANLNTKWSNLRRQVSSAGPLDATSLYQRGAVDLEKLKTRIPKKRQFARTLSDLLEAASSSAVKVGAISYKPVPIKGEALLSYQLSFAVSGSYAAVKSYLADLQKNPEMIVVDAATFTNNDLFLENVVMDLRITVYLREGA